MNQTDKVKKLVELGGNEWEKFSDDGTHYHRVYFNAGVIVEMAGYRWSNYKTGNIRAATLDGKGISNSEMHRVLDGINYSKFWYDVPTDKFMQKTDSSSAPRVWEKAVEILQKAITEEVVNA